MTTTTPLQQLYIFFWKTPFCALIMTKLFYLRFSPKKTFTDFEHTLIAMRLTKFHFNCNDSDFFITISWIEHANHVRGSYDLDKLCFVDSDMIYSLWTIDFMVFRWLFRCKCDDGKRNAFSGYQMFFVDIHRTKCIERNWDVHGNEKRDWPACVHILQH